MISDTTEVLDSIRARGYRGGFSRTKGLFVDSFNGLLRQWSRGGAVAQVARVIDHAKNWYTETVTMRDSGEVIHHCSEPLSEHRGHGTDRRNS